MCTYIFRAAQGAQVLERGGGSVCSLNSAEFDADVNMLCLETIPEVSLLHNRMVGRCHKCTTLQALPVLLVDSCTGSKLHAGVEGWQIVPKGRNPASFVGEPSGVIRSPSYQYWSTLPIFLLCTRVDIAFGYGQYLCSHFLVPDMATWPREPGPCRMSEAFRIAKTALAT